MTPADESTVRKWRQYYADDSMTELMVKSLAAERTVSESKVADDVSTQKEEVKGQTPSVETEKPVKLVNELDGTRVDQPVPPVQEVEEKEQQALTLDLSLREQAKYLEIKFAMLEQKIEQHEQILGRSVDLEVQINRRLNSFQESITAEKVLCDKQLSTISASIDSLSGSIVQESTERAQGIAELKVEILRELANSLDVSSATLGEKIEQLAQMLDLSVREQEIHLEIKSSMLEEKIEMKHTKAKEKCDDEDCLRSPVKSPNQSADGSGSVAEEACGEDEAVRRLLSVVPHEDLTYVREFRREMVKGGFTDDVIQKLLLQQRNG